MGTDIIDADSNSIESASNQCASCGSSLIEPGHATPLCYDCRAKFIKYPIPSVIRIFSLALLIVVGISLFRLPENISMGIHQSRGEKALKSKKFLTAEREFEQVVKKAPNYIEAKADLIIAAYHNQDYSLLFENFSQLEGKLIEDESLYQELTSISNRVSVYFPGDSLLAFQKDKTDSAGNIPIDDLLNYYSANPEDYYALLLLASAYYDKNDYEKSDSILLKVLDKYPDHINALRLMTSSKREQNQYDESFAYCEKMLALNSEDTYAMSSKSRTLLKSGKDKEALKLAKEAEEINKNEPYNKATLVLAYHYNNMIKERDEILNKTKNDSTTMFYMTYASDIINSKVKFR